MNRLLQFCLAGATTLLFAAPYLAHAEDAAQSGSEVKRSGKMYVQVYFAENFKGPSVRLEVPCELENDARLKEKGIKNDSIMSMKIPDGITVTLYAAAGFGGASQEFTGKAPTLGELKGQASSLKAELTK